MWARSPAHNDPLWQALKRASHTLRPLAQLLLILIVGWAPGAGAAEQSYGILGRPGSLVPVLEIRRDGEVAQVLVALAGGSGKRSMRGLPRDDAPNDPESAMGAWRSMAQRVGAVVLVDTPEDHPELTLADRRGKDHEQDVGAVLAHLRKRFPKARLVLFGASNGAYSAAILANSLAPLVDALVLVNGNADAWRRASIVKQPVLGVHHKRDACLPFKASYAIAMQKPFPMIVVDDVRQPPFNPYAAEPDCGPTSAHALYGMRERTYAAIGDWLVDGTVRDKLN